MKIRARLLPLFLSSIFVAVFIAGCASRNRQDESASLRAGVATIDITPPVGYRMAGYFNERFSTGIHDRLHAKALVLQQGDQKLALVSCDLVGLTLSISKAAREQAAAKCGISVSNIVICATHSHTGPLFNDVRNTYFHETAMAQYGYDAHQPKDYGAMLTSKLARVIELANRRVAPASLAAGFGLQQGFPFNRRYRMKNGRVVTNPGRLNPDIAGPAGPVDPSVGILMVRDAKSAPIAGLTVFAMHPDTVGGTLFSADYPYYLEQSLQKALGGSYTSIFGLGPCGDINHIDVSRKESLEGFDAAKEFGTALGHTVNDSLSNLDLIATPSFAARSATFMAPLQEVTPEQIQDARSKMPLLNSNTIAFEAKVKAVKALDLAARGRECPMETQVFRLDANTAIVCLPAEIFVEFGLAIKKQSPFKNTLVISICNDRPSYVPTEKAFAEGSYEVSNARVKPGAGEKIVETALALLGELASAK